MEKVRAAAMWAIEDVEAWYGGSSVFSYAGCAFPYRRGGAGEALVCLHGFPTSSWDFAPIWGALTARFDCVAHDLLGLGRASKPRRAMPIGEQADVVEALCEALGVREAHILAHDLGDTVAQELLARQVEGAAKVRWRSCVFLNGGLFPETHQPRLIQRLLASPLGGLVAKLSTARTFRKNMQQIFGAQTQPTEVFLKGSWELLRSGGGRDALPYLIRYMGERRAQRARWVRPLIEQVVPMRLINGASDPVSGRHAAARYLELVPKADVVLLEGIGHYPHVEAPARVLEALWAFPAWSAVGPRMA
jgi:pimeloyl-ACP methyl ester carboxylesterase